MAGGGVPVADGVGGTEPVCDGVGGAEPVCDGVGGTEPETDTDGVGGRLGDTDGDGCTTERSKLSPTQAISSMQRIERRQRSALHVPDSVRDVAVPSNTVISLSPAISAMRIEKPLGLYTVAATALPGTSPVRSPNVNVEPRSTHAVTPRLDTSPTPEAVGPWSSAVHVCSPTGLGLLRVPPKALSRNKVASPPKSALYQQRITKQAMLRGLLE